MTSNPMKRSQHFRHQSRHGRGGKPLTPRPLHNKFSYRTNDRRLEIRHAGLDPPGWHVLTFFSEMGFNWIFMLRLCCYKRIKIYLSYFDLCNIDRTRRSMGHWHNIVTGECHISKHFCSFTHHAFLSASSQYVPLGTTLIFQNYTCFFLLMKK